MSRVKKEIKMKAPTQKQIDAEITKLEELISKISQYNIFGDDNHAKIKAQIKVLEENLTEDDVYAEFEDEENPDKTCDLVSNARDAALWLLGQSEEGPPSKGWKELVKK